MALRHLLLLTALAGLAGCPTIAGPGYLHPGSAERQQNQAQRFDPYPVTDVAPDMAARPLAFIRPAPENERVQNVDSFMKRYRQPPPIDRYRLPRAIPEQRFPVAPVVIPPPPAAPPFAPPQFPPGG